MKLLSRALRTIYEIRDLLSRRQWFVLLGFTFAQLLSSLLDLAAIALIGLISSLAASNVSLAQLGDRADTIIRILNLDSFDIRGQVLWLGSMVICALVLKSLLSMSLFKLNLNFLARISSQLSQRLIRSFFKMEISFINKKSAQEHIFALTSGVTVLIVGIIGPTVSAIGDLFLICIILIALFLADPGLTILVSLSLLATALITLIAVQGRARHYGRRLSDLQVKSSEMIANGLLLFKIYVVRNAQARIANNIAQLRGDYADVGARAKFLYSISKFVFEITSVLLIFLIGIYAFLSYDVVRGATLVVLFIAASGRVLPAIMRLQQTIVSLRASMSEAERTLNLIRELGEQDTTNKELNAPSREFQGLSFIPNLVLKNVSFYFKKNREILKNFSLDVSAGEVIAIAGSTGIGKTTLVDLILGLRKPIQGTVKISNLDPEEAFELFPGKVSYVPQDTHVFEGTFRENLVVGLDETILSDREIWLSVQRAELVDVVSNLEGELAAKIGDRGNTLSGGQRQRIGIARAILSNPQILILDEATNSLDLGTEKKIFSNLFQHRKTCTGIIISHRLETLRFVDRVIFLESPGVVLQGSLSELTKKSKSFQKLIDKK